MVKPVVLPQGNTTHQKHAAFSAGAAGAHSMHPLPGMHHTHPHHTDPFHQFEGLLLALVFIHVAAFAFWCYLLYASKRRKALAMESVSNSAAAAQKLTDWRSPKDVLKAYQKKQKTKQQMGKA
jgi:hypothetical protein